MFTSAQRSPIEGGPSAVVFDCDGLLVDSTGCWEAAYRAVAEAVRPDGAPPSAALVARLHGASAGTAAEALSAELGRPVTAQTVRDALEERFAAGGVHARPGARELIAWLGAGGRGGGERGAGERGAGERGGGGRSGGERRAGERERGRGGAERGAGGLALAPALAVASNAPRAIVDLALGAAGLAGAFAVVVSAEEVARPKPAPDVYAEACRRLGAEPSSAITFEDSTRGALAARAAGLFVVGVPSASTDGVDADLVVPRLDDPRVFDLLARAGAGLRPFPRPRTRAGSPRTGGGGPPRRGGSR